MSRLPSPTAIREAQSLLLKTVGYESDAKRKKRGLPVPNVSESDAAPLADREGLKLLRQVARRVDGFLNERKNQVDALVTVIRLREFGVQQKHLPVLRSARTLQRICSRGRVASRAEAALVTDVLRSSELATYLGEHAETLGKALDRWQWSGAAAGKS